MPKCVDCGTETDRDVMCGAPDDLRCPVCVRKLRNIYEPASSRPEAPPPPRVTYGVMGLAVVGTLLFWSKNDAVEPIIDSLLSNPSSVWDGQLWRFLTTCFFHANAYFGLHLLFNLYWIWKFGQVLEAWMGSVRYSAFFVLVGVGPVAAEFLFSPHGSIGLSGVGYAMFGLLYALRKDKDFAAEQIQPSVVQVFVVWFFVCIGLTYTGILPVANVAHGAGAALGWLIGRAVLSRQRNIFVAGVAVLVIVIVGATQYMPWDHRYAWHKGDQAFARKDYSAALDWYRRALSADPDNEDLRKNVRRLESRVKP